MKKYYVIISHNGNLWRLDVLARDSKVAVNKAVKRAKFSTKDSTISRANVESVTYVGFYINRRFFAVNSL